MKICFDYEIFWKEKFSSIASRYYFNLINSLLDERILNVRIFANLYINEAIERLPKQILFGKKINKRIPYTGRIIEKFNSIFCNYKINKFNPDIIHKTYYDNKIKKNNAKVVLTVFDLWHEKNFNCKYLPKKYSLNISDHILCPSIKTKNDLVDIYNIDPKKISITYFGIEQFGEKFKDTKIEVFSKPFILYVGKRERYKNFINFIKAFSNSHQLKKDFNIICFGGGPFTKNEKDLFVNYNISEIVLNSKNNEDLYLYNLYKNAKCLVYPSLHEGFGLPPLEAMSLGCPVISSNHEAILEAVSDAASLFNPLEIDDITRALINTIYSNDKINKLKEKGFIQANKFSWKKCAIETIKIYGKVLN